MNNLQIPSIDTENRTGRRLLHVPAEGIRSFSATNNTVVTFPVLVVRERKLNSVMYPVPVDVWDSRFSFAWPGFVEAAKDLQNVHDEAMEEGYPPPSQTAIEGAWELLWKMYYVKPLRFEVYPMPEGQIAIDAPGNESSVLVICEPSGSFLCLANCHRGFLSEQSVHRDRFIQEALINLR